MTASRDERLRHLFDQARALPTAARARYLDDACADDRELRDRVQAMLHEADEAQQNTDTSSTRVAAEEVGSRIGPYRLLQQLGEGGFGLVFLAEQDEPVQRRVALKLIKLGMDTRQVVARFEQERQALAVMDHPNIARVLDAGATATGRPYFVMDLVKGQPIVQFCDQHTFTIDERIALFVQVCGAVQHAHGKGIIHRDIKPSNVLVATQDGRPQAKVIDFGIAKATSQKLTDKTLFTEQRQVIGTLQYMSPEQAEGSLDIDTRTDVYSLGVLLYELLTGSTPFEKSSLANSMYGELQRMIREVDPPRPSTRLSQSHALLADIAAHRRLDGKRLGLRLRGELDWIVMRALEKDRSRRYESARDFAADLERHLRGEAVVAAPPSTGYRLRKFVHRHRTAVLAASAVVLALGLGVMATTVAMFRAIDEAERADAATATARTARTEAQHNEQAAIRAAQLAEAAKAEERAARTRAETVTDFVIAALQTSDPMLGGQEDTTIVAAMQSAIAELDSGRFVDDPETAATLKHTIANILRNHGRFDTAHALAMQVLQLQSKLHPGDHLDVAAALNDAGRATEQLGRPDEAAPLLQRSLAMYERLSAGDDDHVVALRNNLGDLYRQLDRAEEAETLLQQALEMSQRLFPGDHRTTAKILDNLAKLREAQGRGEDAMQLQSRSLAMLRRLQAVDHPDLATAIANMATTFGENGKGDRAEPLFREALAMRRRLHSGDHPSLAQVLTNLAFLLATDDRAAEAEPLLDEALAMNRRLFPGDHPLVAHCLFTLGRLRLDLDRAAEAEPVCQQALEMHERLHQGPHIGTAVCLLNLARACQAQQKVGPAREHFDAAIAMLQKVPEGEAALRDALWRSAEARWIAKDLDGAKRELQELLPLAEAAGVGESGLKSIRTALQQCEDAIEAAKKK